MLGKQTSTLQAVSDLCIWQAASSVWRSLLNMGSDLGFVLLFAIAEEAAEEILGKLVETEAWLTLGMEKAQREMDISQQNTVMPTLSVHAGSLLPVFAAHPTCLVSLPHTEGHTRFKGSPF